MRILLIGGNGFIGSPLTQELLDGGHEAAILHRSSDRAVQDTDVRYIQADRNNLSSCQNKAREFAPDVIIDLILSSGEQARQLMEFARGITPRVVALSSQDVYRAWGVLKRIEPGELEPLPITEKSPLRSTRNLYAPEALRALQGIFGWVNEAYDKIAVEQFIMSSPHVAGTVLRLPMIYGVGDRLNRFFPLLKRIADGRRFILLGDDFAAWRAPRGYVANVAHAIVVAALNDKAGGQIYNICEEPCLPELEWQKRIARQMNWTGEFVVLPVSRTPAHLRFPENAAQHIVVSSDKIRKELGYREIVDIDEGIRRTVAWEQAHPAAKIDPQQFDYAAEDQARAGAA